MCSPEDATASAESTAIVQDSLIKQKLPWGRLYSFLKTVRSHDLVDDEFKCGRGLQCDLVLRGSEFNEVGVLSKLHFVITRQGEEGPVFITDYSKNGTFVNGVLIGKQKRQVLQTDDEISAGFKDLKLYVYKNLKNSETCYLPPELKRKYELGKILGQGACGEVRLVYEKTTCQTFAVKRIKKSTISQIHCLNHPMKIRNEIDILQRVSHPNIISVKEIIETEDNYFIILEHMAGGELTNRILSINRMPESRVKFYFYQILLAIDHLHQEGITHRDIKAENILLVNEDDDTMLKVSDFGLSKMLGEDAAMRTICGTPCYVAPEVLDRKNFKTYNQQVDVWSMGVLLFYMLSSELPFRGRDSYALRKLILNGDYEMTGPNWKHISDPARDLVKKMLQRNPHRRIKIRDIFEHEWIGTDVDMIQRVSCLLDSEEEGSQGTKKTFCDSSSCSSEPPPKKFRQSVTCS